MGFSKKIKEDITVAAANHCCVCHKPKGIKIEVHHIIPKAEGGLDTFENAIALCFDCHSDAGHYNNKHPKGTKLSKAALEKHKEYWFSIVKENKIESRINTKCELKINSSLSFEPKFEEIEYFPVNIDDVRKLFELTGTDIKEMTNSISPYDSNISKVKSIDDYCKYLLELTEKSSKAFDDDSLSSVQPVLFSFGDIFSGLKTRKTHNQSVCRVDLRLVNNSEFAIEDYKIRLKFNNIQAADSIDKRKEMLDTGNYEYNIHFTDDYNAEFVPFERVLVQDDYVDIDSISFLPFPQESEVTIEWTILARNSNNSGIIVLKVIPKIEKERQPVYVEKDTKALKKIMLKYN